MSDVLLLPHDLPRLTARDAWRLGNLLDLRSAPEFAAGHLRRSASLPVEPLPDIPAEDLAVVLADRLPSIFLPPRHEPLAVILATGGQATAVAEALMARGRTDVVPVVLPANARLSSEVWECGPSSRVLWRPPAFLERWANLLPSPDAGPVLDLACGSGRAAVWLAQRGYRVTGVDHLPGALDLARRLAASQGVTVDLLRTDLRDRTAWPAGPWSVVLCFRYLQRDLLAALPAFLSPGGVVMARTFRDAPGFAGPPQAQHRLAPGELLALLPPRHFEILAHEEDTEADGRPAAGVVAVLRPRPNGPAPAW